MKTMKKLLVITPILALLCLAMFASLTPQAKAAPLTTPYFAYVTSNSIFGSGQVNNPGYIVGPSPDGYFAQIYGGNSGDGGEIAGLMSTTVAGGSNNVAIYQYSTSGYYSNEIIYVATSSTGPWTQIANPTISSSTAQWYYYSSSSAYTYVAIAGYDTGNSVNIHIDCVQG